MYKKNYSSSSLLFALCIKKSIDHRLPLLLLLPVGGVVYTCIFYYFKYESCEAFVQCNSLHSIVVLLFNCFSLCRKLYVTFMPYPTNQVKSITTRQPLSSLSLLISRGIFFFHCFTIILFFISDMSIDFSHSAHNIKLTLSISSLNLCMHACLWKNLLFLFCPILSSSKSKIVSHLVVLFYL